MYRQIFVFLVLLYTWTVQLPDTEIVRRQNFVIAATVDGFLCYGTKEPPMVDCHRAVALK